MRNPRVHEAPLVSSPLDWVFDWILDGQHHTQPTWVRHHRATPARVAVLAAPSGAAPDRGMTAPASADHKTSEVH
ncbi:MAG: hypothetical protein C7B46_18235 [Sulfobacillus benefaciens]|uniref:Uncharacterized protein n=1 Tax=Sulfobacillus benefaciens TaxID=453960 RepID=A0A2T2X6Q7_9FIRM|nr:MAG: hypothetical protein C7B46_18235 [Sulfobacillus benefaciens]